MHAKRMPRIAKTGCVLGCMYKAHHRQDCNPFVELTDHRETDLTSAMLRFHVGYRLETDWRDYLLVASLEDQQVTW